MFRLRMPSHDKKILTISAHVSLAGLLYGLDTGTLPPSPFTISRGLRQAVAHTT